MILCIDLNNYNIQNTPKESEKGGTLLYISSDLNYKVRNDIKIYKSKELESVFIEIISKDKKNYIVETKPSETKPKKIRTRTFKSFVQDNFKHDLKNIYCEYTLDIHLHDANHSFVQFPEKINEILDKHAPLKYMSRKQKKNISQPWITKGIPKSIKIKKHTV